MPKPSGRLAAVAAAAAFVLLALAYTWPLATRLTTHTIGFQADSSMWLWNLWHFRHSVAVLGVNPLWTEYQYWPYGANLVLHHYGLLYDFAGYFLQPLVGLVATYNLMILGNLAGAGLLVYALARRAGAEPLAAFAGGAAYAFSSYSSVTLRTGVGLEYMSLFVPPLFNLAFGAALRSRRLAACLGGAFALAAAWACNYYYFCFCMLLIPVFVWAHERPFEYRVERRAPGPARRAAIAALALAGAWMAYALWGGQRQFHGGGSARELGAYVAPYLIFWAALAAFVATRARVRVTARSEARRWAALLVPVTVVALWALMNLPMILAVLHWLRAGESASPPNSWRGGGNPTDLLAILTPSYYQPLWGRWTSRLPGVAGTEHSFMSLTALAGALWLWKRRGDDADLRLWYAGLIFSFLFCLGPWLRAFGYQLYLPLPFYFTHLLPIYNNIQVGFRFNVFAHLFFALLFAVAVTRFAKTVSARRAAWVAPVALLLVGLEFVPDAWPLYDARVPAIFRRLGERPDGAMLDVPFGALFDSMGVGQNLGHDDLALHWQSEFKKPRVGGVLGRVSRRTSEAVHADLFLMDLVRAQEGAPASGLLRDRAAVAAYFRRFGIRYVLVREDQIAGPAKAALTGWPMRRIDAEPPYTLYETAVDRPGPKS